MKKRFNILLAMLLIFAAGCSEDFLDRPPEDTITMDNFYQTTEQVNASTSVLYALPWFNLNDKAHWTIGDTRSGNDWTQDGNMAQFFTFSVTENNPHLNEAWSSLWMVVAHANSVINEMPERVSADVPQAVVDRSMGEGYFMRATAYFYLVRLWGAVPIIENNANYVFDSQVHRNPVEDVYTFIIRDLENAIDLLPESMAGLQAGRVSAWSAKGMLSKVYLTYSGYGQSGSRDQSMLDMARDMAADVINNSGLTLLPDYSNLFMLENENNSESLFALQWVACLDWGAQNTNQAYWAPDGSITGAGDGWGGAKGPTIDLQNEFDDPNDLRRKATYMVNGDFYPGLKSQDGGYTHEIEANEPWPVNAHIKKYVIGNAEDNGGPGTVCFMSTGLNTYILRLADVYLVYAEAVLGNNASTSDAEALTAFNAVRNRAGLDSKSSITWEDIRKERRLEFAYESQYWYDLVAKYYYDPQWVIDYLSNQERGTYEYDEDAGEMIINSNKFAMTESKFYLPFPQGDASSNPLLLEDPVPYEFGNDQ